MTTDATLGNVPLSDQLGISAEVAELLRERDMYAEPAYTGRTDLLLVRDEEGTALFQMTPATKARATLPRCWTRPQKRCAKPPPSLSATSR